MIEDDRNNYLGKIAEQRARIVALEAALRAHDEALSEADLQLAYLDSRFPTGTTPAVLVRIRLAREAYPDLGAADAKVVEIMTDAELRAEDRELEAENALLRKALKPFASVATEWDGEPDSLEVEFKAYDPPRMAPTALVADFRRARFALAQTPSTEAVDEERAHSVLFGSERGVHVGDKERDLDAVSVATLGATDRIVGLLNPLSHAFARQEAEAKLPEGMKHRTILYKECELGHGWLTAKNWVQHGCPTCAIKEAATAMRERCARSVDWRTSDRRVLAAAIRELPLSGDK